MWAGLSCFLSIRDGYVGDLLELQQGCEVALGAPDADDTILMAESEEELKSLLMKVKEERKSSRKAQHSENLRSWHPVPSLHGK